MLHQYFLKSISPTSTDIYVEEFDQGTSENLIRKIHLDPISFWCIDMLKYSPTKIRGNLLTWDDESKKLTFSLETIIPSIEGIGKE